MSILNDLQAASFKGAPFLINSGTTSGGRKTVVHEYPNADRRFVEDLGELNETFTIEGTVHGDNYFAKRDRLIAALKSGGSGELIHPFFGAITVTAQPYSVAENLNGLGVATFSMTFDKSSESVFPRQSANNKSLIDIQKSNTISGVQTDIANIFNVSRQFPLNFTDAKSVSLSIAAAMGVNSDTFSKVTTEISAFNADLEAFTDNVNGNMFDPENLANDFTNLFNSFETIGTTAQNQFDISQGLFNFGVDQEQLNTTTLQRIERNSNRDILNSAVRTNALAQAYNTIPNIDFATESDIKATQNILNDQFDFVISDNNLSDDSVQNIKSLNVEVGKFLEQEAVNAFRVSQIQTHEVPTTILTYQYYGNVDKTQQIIDLNNTTDPTFINNTVDILTT